MAHSKHNRYRHQQLLSLIIMGLTCLLPAVSFAQEASGGATVPGNGVVGAVSNSLIVPTGSTSASNGLFQNTGVGINGSANGSNLTSVKNSVQTGSNTNANSNNNIVLTPTQSQAVGGNSAVVLPRNPMTMQNAQLGRSNFGLQFGVENQPRFGSYTGGSGGNNALGWFMQAGLNIPFGKIPEALLNTQNTKLDDIRQNDMDARRSVFANMAPQSGIQPWQAQTNVQGRILNGQQSAYNFSTIPTNKIKLDAPATIGEIKSTQARVIALKPGEVFSRPLNTGEKIGSVQVGAEYPYLGHLKSGWVKVLLPSGAEGWTNTQYEYVKHDFTLVDELASSSGEEKPISSHSKRLATQDPKDVAPENVVR